MTRCTANPECNYAPGQCPVCLQEAARANASTLAPQPALLRGPMQFQGRDVQPRQTGGKDNE